MARRRREEIVCLRSSPQTTASSVPSNDEIDITSHVIRPRGLVVGVGGNDETTTALVRGKNNVLIFDVSFIRQTIYARRETRIQLCITYCTRTWIQIINVNDVVRFGRRFLTWPHNIFSRPIKIDRQDSSQRVSTRFFNWSKFVDMLILEMVFLLVKFLFVLSVHLYRGFPWSLFLLSFSILYFFMRWSFVCYAHSIYSNFYLTYELMCNLIVLFSFEIIGHRIEHGSIVSFQYFLLKTCHIINNNIKINKQELNIWLVGLIRKEMNINYKCYYYYNFFSIKWSYRFKLLGLVHCVLFSEKNQVPIKIHVKTLILNVFL